jgi:hypothetical protein
MITIKITYACTTPESCEFGEFSDTGWINDKGFIYDSVSDAVEFLKQSSAILPSSSQYHEGIWYSTEFYTSNYQTGEMTEESYHITASVKDEKEIYNQMTN